jgi:enamine deaminase RidA (YjgF/YER057c/UK114 family)
MKREVVAPDTVYREFFPHDPPASTTIECGMARPEILVEIDCVAAVSGKA